MSKTKGLYDVADYFSYKQTEAYHDIRAHWENGDELLAHISKARADVYDDITEQLWSLYSRSFSGRIHLFLRSICNSFRNKTQELPF